ncbi:beta-N-acetylhexosaminidase [Gelidibacter maritimus]|uniref:beta-N-acetylhexosaminidase n=1 Tax=Gelidibacter maritimus TaxID=2761487 RepID=A0A7W2R3F9_9FLAO|nr:beta-N-acetylhexosaminidase [Gelidibacter maritimus]MBA6152801.1 beta-N-acetylhexosaminidase [Gelidibacter maritimus]
MKHFIIIALVSLAFMSCTKKYQHLENTDEDYAIIPKPLVLEPQTGRFLVDASTTIVGDETLSNEGNFLAELLSMTLGTNIQFSLQNAKGDIVLEIDPAIENEEGYELYVDYDKIRISGKNSTGVFYGIQTLRQLIPLANGAAADDGKELTIPAVVIKDHPQFVYRGMHLDVARHFFPVAFVKKYIDLIAMHKMNTFHWHLTEDQGWRIEIKKYPKLTEIGAIRKETVIEKNFDPYIADGIPYGGFYTQEEIKDVVAYAQTKHVTIIPEIDLPGHSRAAIAAYPELGNTGEQYEVATTWGVFEEIYAPTETTFNFLEDVLTEVMALFPSEYIHIGGDEAPKKQWEESRYAQELMKKEGLKDEDELQSYFIKRVEKFVNSKGRKIIGWDEIIEGGLAPNAAVMFWRSWTGEDEIIEAAKNGHNIIMTPASHVYFDAYQVPEEDHAKEKFAIGGFTSVEKVYGLNIIPEALPEEFHKYILGAQANLWSEYIKTSEHAEYMVLPRMTALSEVVWSSEEQKDWSDFKVRLDKMREQYDALGLNYAKHVFESE